MKKSFLSVSIAALLFFSTNFANAESVFIEGKDYRQLPPETMATVAAMAPPASPDRIQVIAFFNYGCPACYRLEPGLEAFIQKKPPNVDIESIPVTFHPNWDRYAKAFYTAKSLGILNKITPAMFTAIHVEQRDLSDNEAIAQIFAKVGSIDKAQFDAIFHHSPAIDLAVANGDRLLQAYGITAVPSIVVAKRYVTSMAMTQNETRLFDVIRFLINKEKQARKKN